MTFQDALARYFQWAKQFPGDPNIPNESLSEEHDGNWHLHNINGPLVVVMTNGDVIAVGKFWATYERLAEDGKCDSPGGAEYQRMLTEWIEQQPDNMEEFICGRASQAEVSHDQIVRTLDQIDCAMPPVLDRITQRNMGVDPQAMMSIPEIVAWAEKKFGHDDPDVAALRGLNEEYAYWRDQRVENEDGQLFKSE